MANADPHADAPLLHIGPKLEEAAGVIVMMHGRGASAESILSLYPELGLENLAALAPQAAGYSWYPQSFLAPLEMNQPYLDSALTKVETVVGDMLSRGIASSKIALLGFSQGACLTTEFVARHPRRYGAVMALTGGLIGPAGTPRDYVGALDQTPVFLGSSDPDPHVPFARVKETHQVLTQMGAKVDMRRYPGMPHSINEEEIEVCRQMLRDMLT